MLSALEKLSFIYHMNLKKDLGNISFWNWLDQNEIEPSDNSINNFYITVKRKIDREKL